MDTMKSVHLTDHVWAVTFATGNEIAPLLCSEHELSQGRRPELEMGDGWNLSQVKFLFILRVYAGML